MSEPTTNEEAEALFAEAIGGRLKRSTPQPTETTTEDDPTEQLGEADGGAREPIPVAEDVNQIFHETITDKLTRSNGKGDF